MGKVNICLKRVFVVFNVLFAIVGALIMIAGIHAARYKSQFDETVAHAIHWVIAIGVITMVVSLLGAYGADKEKKWALIPFFIAMVAGGLVVFGISVALVPAQSMVKDQLYSFFNETMPLDQADEESKDLLSTLQEELSCCGLLQGYQDWGSSIPKTCKCSSSDEDTAKCLRVTADDSEVQVYEQPCGPIIQSYVEYGLRILLGIFFGITAVAFIGSILSMVMICQIRRPTGSARYFTDGYKPPAF